MFQSNSKYYIKSTISSTQTAGTTFLISPDFELGKELETGSSSVSLVLKNGSQIERFEITATGGVATIVSRGLTQSGSAATADVSLQKQWTDGTIAYITSLAFDMIDKQGDTMTGALKFSGTTNPGLIVNSLSTSERTALSATNGTIVYDTDLGENYQYVGGSWSAVSAGSTQPNASVTVAGKVEIATTAETQAGTNTGGTGAQLVALPSDIAANQQSSKFVYAADTGSNDTYVISLTPAITEYTTGQRIRFKANTINTGACSLNVNSLGAKSIKTLLGSDPKDGDIAASEIVEVIYDGTNFVLQKALVSGTDRAGLAEMATDAEAMTGSDQVRYINPYQTRLTACVASDNLRISSDVQAVSAQVSYTKVKEMKFSNIPFGGPVRVKFTLSNGIFNGTAYGRIYKNGVAVGTERTVGGAGPASAEFSEDITIANGDLLQIYAYGSGATAYITNFRVYYDRSYYAYDAVVTLA